MRIIRQYLRHSIKAVLNQILPRVPLGSPPQMHELSQPRPPQRLFDGAIFDSIVLNNATVEHVLPRDQRGIFTALLIRKVRLRFDIILHIPKHIIRALTNEHFHHFRIPNLHRYFQRRSLTIRWIRRAAHRL